MSAIDSGGPAFPVANDIGLYVPGATLRDLFAAVALHTLITHPNLRESGEYAVADCAYAFADAMIERRSQP